MEVWILDVLVGYENKFRISQNAAPVVRKVYSKRIFNSVCATDQKQVDFFNVLC